MRPHGETRLDLAAALVDGGGTTRQLAQRTGWSIGACRVALDNMVRGGDAVKRMVRVAGVKRPVPFYERATPEVDDAAERPICLLAAWAMRQPVPITPMGAAM